VVNDVMNAAASQLKLTPSEGATFALYLSDCSMKENVCEVFSEKALQPDEPIDRILVLIENQSGTGQRLLFKKRFFVGDNIPKSPFVAGMYISPCPYLTFPSLLVYHLQ
jgi:hypothetical protein